MQVWYIDAARPGGRLRGSIPGLPKKIAAASGRRREGRFMVIDIRKVR
jgi:hypothetical protein